MAQNSSSTIATGQPKMSLSPTFLTMFEGHSFLLHGIIPSFPVQLEGKTMCRGQSIRCAPQLQPFVGMKFDLHNDNGCILHFSCTMFSS
jgi:hypothetical protein